MTIQEVLAVLNAYYPFAYQESWDNSGLQVGRLHNNVTGVLLSLDITGAVISEAIQTNSNLIITHHPLLFHPLKCLSDYSVAGKYTLQLAENGISVISAHTNLDMSDGGVNDTLAALLGGTITGKTSDGLGRYAEFSYPVAGIFFLQKIKQTLQVNALRFVGGEAQIQKYCVVGGAGGEYYLEAKAAGCDALITSDIKYHQFLEADALGLTLIDADHFCTEAPVMNAVLEMLRLSFPGEASLFRISSTHRQIVHIYGVE